MQIILTVNDQQANIILRTLIEQPYKLVGDLVPFLNAQIQHQLEQAKNQPVAPPERDKKK